ncbi:MAG: hypothetical protein ORN83_05280 [Chthoniobacteraceae bacterium]|nr:hypothetical protein [Chthoniobacteraceae bacterium]
MTHNQVLTNALKLFGYDANSLKTVASVESIILGHGYTPESSVDGACATTLPANCRTTDQIRALLHEHDAKVDERILELHVAKRRLREILRDELDNHEERAALELQIREHPAKLALLKRTHVEIRQSFKIVHDESEFLEQIGWLLCLQEKRSLCNWFEHVDNGLRDANSRKRARTLHYQRMDVGPEDTDNDEVVPDSQGD